MKEEHGVLMIVLFVAALVVTLIVFSPRNTTDGTPDPNYRTCGDENVICSEDVQVLCHPWNEDEYVGPTWCACGIDGEYLKSIGWKDCPDWKLRKLGVEREQYKLIID